MIEDYSEYRKIKLESGGLYQDFVVDCCWNILGLAVVQYTSKLYQMQVGESKVGAEIKHNELYKKTGNLYIEYAEKKHPRPGPYALSGIKRQDNTWLFITGDYDTVFIFSKKMLLLLGDSGRYRNVENGTKTSLGWLLPNDDAVRYSAQILYPNAEQKLGKMVKDLHQAAKELFDIVKRGKDEQLDLFNKWTQ